MHWLVFSTEKAGCEITKNYLVSFRKPISKIWVSENLSGFPNGSGASIDSFWLSEKDVQSETLVKKLGFRLYFWVSRTPGNSVISHPGSWASCLFWFIQQLSNPRLDMNFYPQFMRIVIKLLSWTATLIGWARNKCIFGYIPFGSYDLDSAGLYSLMDSLYSLINQCSNISKVWSFSNNSYMYFL